MKHWNRKLPVKIICFILCVLSLVTFAASLVGAAFLIGGGFYGYPEKRMIEDTVYNKVRRDAYDIVLFVLGPEEEYYFPNEDYSPDSTNLRFRLFAPDARIVETNVEKGNVSWDYSFPCYVRFTEYGTSVQFLEEGYDGDNEDNLGHVYCVKLYLEEGLPVNDEYALIHLGIGIAYDLLYWIYPIGVLALAIFITTLIMLVCSSARRPNDNELHPGVLNRVPIDLMLAVLFLVFAFALELIVYEWYTGEVMMHVLLGVWTLCLLNVVVGLVMSISARIKQRTLFSNTVIAFAVKFIFRVLKMLRRGIVKFFFAVPMIWRTLTVLFVNILVDYTMLWLLYEWEWEIAVPICVIKNLCLTVIALGSAWAMRRLQKGGQAIAKGELSYRVDTRFMIGDFRRHGENLNSISDAVAVAVDQHLKSERMKTELITNVSHDIKTPLTSIINYASLIAGEECSSQNHKEYSEVLVRKSEHLKRLLDDLVEVSKANTGNLDVELTPCEAGVLLTQVSGEFEERCRAAGLELIAQQPEESVHIMADSRRIWRVFENFMSNACKYSLPGSRVYLSLEYTKNEVLFIFRNTSAAALNVTPDELMERFVRGDSSRTTEGSGLGLSIARSLTELQNGRMDITIDGDLFKVTLRFPTV